MAPFATSDDLGNRLGVEFTEAETFRADELLTLASGLIQDEATQTIDVASDTLVMPGTNDETILLPQRPVLEVESVTLNGAELVEGADWYLDGDTIVRIPAGVAVLPSGLADEELGGRRGFGSPTQTLQIGYLHGYLDIPPSVKAICLEAVVRVWVNPGNVAQERVGDTSTLYTTAGAPSGLLLTKAEQLVIRRLFGRTATSITIGR